MIRALAGLMMIICGGLIPSAIIIPKLGFSLSIISLPSTWQVSGLLLCALVCGPRPAVIAAFAYITIGLFYLPIFHGGGSVGYIFTPAFGYLIGFIPAAWVSGYLSKKAKKKDFIRLTLFSFIGLVILQSIGIINLVIGSLMGIWQENFLELLFIYTVAPLPSQLSLCTAVGILAILMRRIILI